MNCPWTQRSVSFVEKEHSRSLCCWPWLCLPPDRSSEDRLDRCWIDLQTHRSYFYSKMTNAPIESKMQIHPTSFLSSTTHLICFILMETDLLSICHSAICIWRNSPRWWSFRRSLATMNGTSFLEALVSFYQFLSPPTPLCQSWTPTYHPDQQAPILRTQQGTARQTPHCGKFSLPESYCLCLQNAYSLGRSTSIPLSSNRVCRWNWTSSC